MRNGMRLNDGASLRTAMVTRWRSDRDHHRLDRTVVITTETQPNFSSGAAAWTPDEGRTWYTLPNVSGYWAVAFANPHAGWFVGNNGSDSENQLLIRILRFTHCIRPTESALHCRLCGTYQFPRPTPRSPAAPTLPPLLQSPALTPAPTHNSSPTRPCPQSATPRAPVAAQNLAPD